MMKLLAQLSVYYFLINIAHAYSTTAPLQNTNFEYVGGFCRSGNKSQDFHGEYTAGCSWHSSCSLEKCARLCIWQQNCTGFEYSFEQRTDNVTCELHATSVDYAKEYDFQAQRCYRRIEQLIEDTSTPTVSPTPYPTVSPTQYPTLSPTPYPTSSPTNFPSSSPTISPINSSAAGGQASCFEYVGGFCRYNGNPRYGVYTVGCTLDDICSIEECEQMCQEMENCQGYEYAYRKKTNGVVCELHETSIDYAQARPLNQDQCFRKITCPEPY